MYLAVDIGGTKTLLAAFSADGQVVARHKFLTPADYNEFVQLFGSEIKKLGQHPFKQGVMAVPGRLDRELGVAIAFGNRPWENTPIVHDFQPLLPCPVRIENDAKLAGLSEALLIINEFKKVLYVTISTGIGSALIINGKIDINSQDSEGGQLLLEHNGKLMDWEDFGSGRAFKEKFGLPVGEITDPEAFYYIARNIAIGLIDLIATYTPEVIVLGGGVGAHLEKFQDRLEEELKIYANPLFAMPALRKAQRAEDAVIYGCYELAKEKNA